MGYRLEDFFVGRGRVHGEIVVPVSFQGSNRLRGGVDMPVGSEDASRTSFHDAPFLGMGMISFTSAMDTVGKFFANSRNHMKNHAKLPERIAQSTHDGV